MDGRWRSLLNRLEHFFPEADGVVLAAIIEKHEALIRYIAQIHELTIAEAREVFELALLRPSLRPAIAAE